jgi:hypothetical protein
MGALGGTIKRLFIQEAHLTINQARYGTVSKASEIHPTANDG